MSEAPSKKPILEIPSVNLRRASLLFPGTWDGSAAVPSPLSDPPRQSRPTNQRILRLRGFSLSLFCAVLGVVSGAVAELQAQTVGPPPATTQVEGKTSASTSDVWQNRGRWTFGFQLGYAVENAIPRNISHINMLIAQPQVGLIVSQFRRGPLSRFEIVNEGILGNAVHPGGHLLGTSLLFRFDAKPHGRFVPFLDVGAGILHTTLDTRAPELSGHLQFLPQAGLGVHYFVKPQRAWVFEYRYVHMSNAGIELPNHGFNASMITVGFRWLRRP